MERTKRTKIAKATFLTKHKDLAEEMKEQNKTIEIGDFILLEDKKFITKTKTFNEYDLREKLAYRHYNLESGTMLHDILDFYKWEEFYDFYNIKVVEII